MICRLLLILLVLGLVLAFAGVQMAQSARPRLVQVDQPFVYWDGQFLLVQADGQYVLTGNSAPPGCYQLFTPRAGETHGRAAWTSDRCE